MDENLDTHEEDTYLREEEPISKNIRLTAGIILGAIVFVIGAFLINGSSSQSGNVDSSSIENTSVNQNVKSAGVTGEPRMFSVDQLVEHSSSADCYVVYKSVVYDISDFVSEHPGGPKIAEMCGKVLDDFSEVH